MIQRPMIPPPHRDPLWLLYRGLLLILSPIWIPWGLIRLMRGTAREREERLGGGVTLAPPQRPRLWFHGVSVGEVEALAPVVAATQRLIPEVDVVVSATTPTGRARVEALYPQVLDRRFTPVDLPWTTQRALRRIQPSALVLAESELWPALLFAAAPRIPVIVVNGRISDQTLPRARRLRPLYAWMLRRLTLVGVQTEEDGARLRALGLPAGRLQVTGNVKFDRAIERVPDEEKARLRESLGVGVAPLLVAGSTFPGEDDLLLRALTSLRAAHPSGTVRSGIPPLDALRLILVPRHPDRADAVESEVRSAGYRVWRRSLGPAPAPGTHPDADPDVVLVDTVGELAALYGLAHIAVIGRSFRMGGGQNPLEPMAHGVPVVYGPRMENFRTIAQLAEDGGAARRCDREEELVPTLLEIMTNPDLHAAMAAAGPRVLTSHQGAADRSARLIQQALEATP